MLFTEASFLYNVEDHLDVGERKDMVPPKQLSKSAYMCCSLAFIKIPTEENSHSTITATVTQVTPNQHDRAGNEIPSPTSHINRV
ncbi:hypothetical protein TNCV_2269111 [Trichonephila clavipes]|nr:hypothetical protein TNCV_2269111 [Trichonephila clavipes]